jgi:hypothetical protein
MPLTAADKARANMGGYWAHADAKSLASYHPFYGFADGIELASFQLADLSGHEAGMSREQLAGARKTSESQ